MRITALLSCILAAASCQKKTTPAPAPAPGTQAAIAGSTDGAPPAALPPPAVPNIPGALAAAPSARNAAPLPLASARAYSNQWLVILSSSKLANEVPAGLTALVQNPAIPAAPARFSSSELKGLMPCYEVVIANAFPTREDAAAFAAKLRPLGIDHYLKYAGRFVGAQPKLDAYCKAEKTPKPPSRCAGVHFVEHHGKKSFLELDLDDAAASRVPRGGKEKPLDTTFKAWSAPLAARTLGAYSVGQKYTLLAPNKSAPAGTCTLTSFVWLTRGTPHFGYYEEYNQTKKAPAAPSCGKPELFAEVDCGGAKGALAIATAQGAAAPTFFDAAPIKDAKVVDEVKRVLTADARYRPLLARAQAHAKKQNQPLKERFSLRSATRKDGAVFYVLDATLETGAGNDACGGEDLRMQLVGAVERGKDPKDLVVRSPLRERAAETLGVVDLRGDGKLQFFEQDGWGRTLLTEGGAKPLCESVVAYCDCAC